MRPATLPSITAVIPAARPVSVRNWPAAAVETWSSLAAFASTGDIAISAAWPAKRLVKSAALTARYPSVSLVVSVIPRLRSRSRTQQTRSVEASGWD